MKENNPHILGTEKVGKLLLEYSIPAIIGMTLTSLYNIIDSVFIGHGVGAMAISGLAISFPLMNLLVAFCTLVGVGGATISSIRLGQKDTDGAEKVLGNVTVLCVINSIFYGGITLLFLDRILFFFGASHDTLPYARDFMQIILIGSPVTYVMIGLNNIMRATGYPRKAMLSSMLTVGCNIILAPVFIFWLGWGIRGAATATILSQFAGMIWVLSHFMQEKGWKVSAIEKSPQAREFALQHFGLQVAPPEALAQLEPGSFDVITLWHVMEHLQHLNETWEQLYQLLDKQGILILAVPNPSSFDARHYGAEWAAYDVPRHLWHFTPSVMQQFGAKHGFKLAELHPMPFDAFYVSMLSEKNRGSRLAFVKGMWIGFKAWLASLTRKERSSSMIYVFRKK